MEINMKCSVIKKFFYSKYGPLIIGIILSGIVTGAVGLIINYFVQNSIINRAQKFEIYKLNMQSANRILIDTVNLINQRLFYLKRLWFTYRDGSTEDAQVDWKNYRDQIANWNVNAMAYKIRLTIYFSDDLANRLISSQHKVAGGDLYTLFNCAHSSVLKLKSCLRINCKSMGLQVCRTKKCNAQKKLYETCFRKLSHGVDKYTSDLYHQFSVKYAK